MLLELGNDWRSSVNQIKEQLIQFLSAIVNEGVSAVSVDHTLKINYTKRVYAGSGTAVVVNKTSEHLYIFTVKDEEKGTRQITYNNQEVFTGEKQKELDFDQLNALRHFWLETRNEED